MGLAKIENLRIRVLAEWLDTMHWQVHIWKHGTGFFEYMKWEDVVKIGEYN
jgi:hypothetical protein